MKALLWSYLSSSLENKRKLVRYHQGVGGDAHTQQPGSRARRHGNSRRLVLHLH